MISRTRFFVASIWAPLPPVGMLVGICAWILLFPGTFGFDHTERRAAAAGLIAVPFLHTAIFGVSYVSARALYSVHALSRIALMGVCVVVAGLIAAAIFGTSIGRRIGTAPGLAVVAVSFLAAVSAVLMWWRVASTEPPPHVRRRHGRSGRHGERSGATEGAASPAPGPAPLGATQVAVTDLIVRWDAGGRCLLILHPDRARYPEPLARIGEGMLHGMSSHEASRVIGESFTQLIPELRARYMRAPDAGERQAG